MYMPLATLLTIVGRAGRYLAIIVRLQHGNEAITSVLISLQFLMGLVTLATKRLNKSCDSYDWRNYNSC